MNRFYADRLVFAGVIIIVLVLCSGALMAQCTNADFGTGNFNGWTGTYGTDATQNGCAWPNPTQYTGFNQGPLNDPPNDANNQYNQVMCSAAAGNDPILSVLLAALPMVWPGGGSTFSARIGNMWQKVGNGNGDGETISYSMLVTPANCYFTYHYAVVLNDGGHALGQQPYFNIALADGSGNDISCGDFQVDATTAQTIGGFNNISANAIWWKPWTSVLIPLNNFIGQTVTVTFTTRGCYPSRGGHQCAGSHWAYAYISAECGPPGLIASSPTICSGQGVTLTAPPGAATYSWSGPAVTAPTNTQSVVITQAGRYTVTMTTFGSIPCTFSLDTLIGGNPLGPTANFSASPTCVGNPTTFTDLSTPTGQITGWAWDFNGDGVTDTSTQNPAYTFPAAGSYVVKLIITASTCTADTMITVVVSPTPTSDFTVVSPVCAGVNSTITYTGTAAANATYNWNFAGGTVASGSGQGPYQVNWATAGTKNITLTVTLGSCSSPLTTVPVTVDPIPVLTISPATAICLGSNTAINVSGATTYSWAPDPGLSDTNTASVIATPASTSGYSVTGTSLNCTATATVTVTVYPIPTSAFTVVTPVCINQNSTITYTGTATAAATYAWNFAGGTALPGGTGQGPQQVSWTASGTQNVILVVTEHGCVSPPDTMPVVVKPTPTSTFTVVSPVCIGQTSTITYTGVDDNTSTYTWNFAGGQAVPGTGQGPQQITWATAGTKDITLLVTENGCPSLVTINPVIVHAIPTADFTVTSPLCAGQNGTITYTGSSSSVANLNWGFDNGNVVPAGGRGPFRINWSNASMPIVSLTVTDSGCVSPPDSIPVTVYAIPISNAGNDTAFCSGNPVVIGAGNTAGYTYLWSPVTGLNSPTLSNPTLSLTNSANSILIKTYTVTTTSNGCVSRASVTDTINPIPAALFTHLAPQCFIGNSFSFASNGTNLPSAAFAWDFGIGAVPATSTLASQTVTYSSPLTRAVTLTVSQASGCTNTYIDSVTVFPMPVAGFSPDTVLGCENFEVCFINNSIAVAPPTYLWNFGDGEVSTDINPCHLYVAPGVYSVYLKVISSEGCIDTLTRIDLIKVIADPIAKFTPSASVIQQPESEIDFTNESSNALTYLWTFDAAGNSTDINPKVNFLQYGLYNVMLRSYNMLGCVDSTQLPITVLPPQNFFIPNAFTPNGDGNNDVFYVDMQEGVTLYSFQVYDRWGEKMHDGLYPWDGNYKGKPCPPAVYVYVAKMKLATNVEAIMRKGSVTLIR